MTKSDAFPAIDSLIEEFIEGELINDLMDESPSLYEQSLLAVAAHRKLIEPESALIKESDSILDALKKFKKERE